MNEIIIEFISQYVDLSDEEYDIIFKQALFVPYLKGDYLLKEERSLRNVSLSLKAVLPLII